ncbi:hypothetical protein MLD38_019598 [Melastoma candidum]|uniref:Uncharacterized protein n=1 Tax=Melastoma candidum TaxID=119954 RepID=A0ACB9QWZ4_9MYRT|nr:hypothetical protein MLD38_019598 [Melastoma candidum]
MKKSPGEAGDPAGDSPDDPEPDADLGLFVDVKFPEFSEFEPGVDEETTPDVGVPRPMDIFQGSPVPPFLSKTYEIVDDRALDPIVSWSRGGQSFVVWDPVEFARVVLPRNFKHNNFSSFVRQLNTYGFRKIDAERWEFANEGFQRGKRNLLKNIQRRKSPQSQQPGSSSGHLSETAWPGAESEVERLKAEKTILMKEVIELQHQQQGMAHHAQAVNQRIQAAEQKQKQMVSFLAKLLKNPSFVERLKERKEQKKIGSSKSKRKFLEQGRTELDECNQSVEGQVAGCGHSWGYPGDPSGLILEDPHHGGLPEHFSEDWIGMQWGSEAVPSQAGGFWSRDSILPHDSSSVEGYFRNSQQFGKGSSVAAAWDPKGKTPITSGDSRTAPEYFVSFPEEMEERRSFSGFSAGFESIVKQEEIWNMGFDVSANMPSPGGEIWGNIPPFNEPVHGVTAGLSDIWDLGPLPASRELGSDNWPEGLESEAGQEEDITSKENFL